VARRLFAIAAYTAFFALVVMAIQILDFRDVLKSAESRTLFFKSSLHFGDAFYFIHNELKRFDDLLVLVLVNMAVVHIDCARELAAQTP